MTKSASTFYGWYIVAAAFVVAVFGWGLGFYGPAVYLETVVRATGWSVAIVSGAVTLHFLVGAFVIANLPALHRRFGLPQITMAGALLLALGVGGWAAAQSPWQLYGAALLSGAGWPALGAAAVNAIVSPWFVRRRPAALSTAYNGASIGGVIFSPLWVALIAWIGFPLAVIIIDITMLCVIALLAFGVLVRTPESMRLLPDGDAPNVVTKISNPGANIIPVSDLRRDPAFLTLAAGMALALFAQIGLLAHLVSLLVPTLGIQGAGIAAGLSTAAAIVGRQLVGWFMPAWADRRAVVSASLLIQALGCVALLMAGGTSVPLVITGVALIGLGIGNATSLPPLVAQIEFGKDDVARVVALIVAIAQGTYSFAPAAFGFLRDNLSEQAVYLAAVFIQLAAIAVYMRGRKAYAVRALPSDERGPVSLTPQR